MVSRCQLLALGLTAGAIDRRLISGRLISLHRGVYAVGHRALSQRGVWMAAVLASGPGALLSHLSAADLWGLADQEMRRSSVIVVGDRRQRPGIRVRGTRRLGASERVQRYGIPVTSVSRTLVDLASILGERRLREAVERADRLRLLRAVELREVCDRSRGRRGVAVLRLILAELSEPDALSRSELERRFRRFCGERDLPTPAQNVIVAGLEVDCAWPSARLVAEVDGWATHGGRAAFERDRRRDSELLLAGWRVIRPTHLRIEREPERLAGEIRRLLGRRPAPS